MIKIGSQDRTRGPRVDVFQQLDKQQSGSLVDSFVSAHIRGYREITRASRMQMPWQMHAPL